MSAKMFQITVTLIGLTSTGPCFLSRQLKGFSLKLRAASCHRFYNPAVTELSGLGALESMPQRLEFPAQGRALPVSNPRTPISSLFHSTSFYQLISSAKRRGTDFAFPRKLTLYWLLFMSFTNYLTIWALLDISQGWPLLTHYPTSSGNASLRSSYRQNHS